MQSFTGSATQKLFSKICSASESVASGTTSLASGDATMEPRITEGDRAILTPGRETRAGDTVIARTMNGDVMCKLFQSKNDGQVIVLSSWNPAFPPVELRREEIAWMCPVRQIVQNYGHD